MPKPQEMRKPVTSGWGHMCVQVCRAGLSDTPLPGLLSKNHLNAFSWVRKYPRWYPDEGAQSWQTDGYIQESSSWDKKILSRYAYPERPLDLALQTVSRLSSLVPWLCLWSSVFSCHVAILSSLPSRSPISALSSQLLILAFYFC